MTEKEQEVMDHLTAAWNAFMELEQQHPQHQTDFMNGIHQCQYILSHRVVQRDHPAVFQIIRTGQAQQFIKPKED